MINEPGHMMLLMLDAAAKGAVIVALTCVAALLMRRAAASTRHMVHQLAVVACLLMPALCAALPAWQILTRWLDAPTAQTTQTPGTPVPGVLLPGILPNEHAPETRPHTIAPAPPEVKPPRQDAPLLDTAPADVAPTLTVAPPPAPKHHPISTWTWIAAAWSLGAAIALSPLLLGYLSLRRLTQTPGTPVPGVLNLLDQLRADLNIKQSVRLLQSPTCTMPLTFGILRPTILLPGGPRFPRALPDTQLRAVLLHELAHIKRRNCLTQLLAQLACALYWFNPLLWYAAHRMRIERERACDDLVLHAGSPPADYAEQLLMIATDARHHKMAAFAGIAMARKSTLEGRLLAILDEKRNRKTLTRFAVAIAALLLVAATVPVAMLRAQAPNDAHIAGPESQSKAALPDGSRIEKIARLRNALAARPNHPDNLTIEFELAVHIENSVPAHDESKRKAKWAEARTIYEHIVNTYDHMSYYTTNGADAPRSPELLVPYAAVCMGFRCGGEKGRQFHYRAMTYLKQTVDRRTKDWETATKPDFDPGSPFTGGPIEKSKWESRVNAWKERRRRAATGDVLSSTELSCAQSAVRGYVETLKPEAAADALREIIRDFSGTPLAKIAGKKLERAANVQSGVDASLKPGNRTQVKVVAEEVTKSPRRRTVDRVDYPFVNDPQLIGQWKSVDFVQAIEDFEPGVKHWPGDMYLKEMFIHEAGRTSGPWTWTKGLILHPGDKTAAKYQIKNIDGSTYMFFEWKSGDYSIRGMKPRYYVLNKVDASSVAPGLTFTRSDDIKRMVISGGRWTVWDNALHGTCERDEGWATVDALFKRIDAVRIRAMIVPPSVHNLRIWAGPLHLIFNWEVKDENHYRNVDKGTVTRPRALTPGQWHDIELKQAGEKVVVTVDGKAVYETKAKLAGTVSVQSALGSTIAVQRIAIDGEVDRSVRVLPLTASLPSAQFKPAVLPANAVILGHVDDSAEGKRSIAGSGHAVKFEAPGAPGAAGTADAAPVVAVQIFAGRYGRRQPPDEDFHVYLLDADMKVIADHAIPYATIERGEMRWYALKVPPTPVPEKFFVALSFNPHRTKGVYLGYDESVEQSHSYTGLPDRGFKPVKDKYDWMVRAVMAPAEQKETAASDAQQRSKYTFGRTQVLVIDKPGRIILRGRPWLDEPAAQQATMDVRRAAILSGVLHLKRWSFRCTAQSEAGPAGWDISADDVVRRLKNQIILPGAEMESVDLPEPFTAPQIFLFRTSEDAMGIMKVLRSTIEPMEISVRYKLVEEALRPEDDTAEDGRPPMPSAALHGGEVTR